MANTEEYRNMYLYMYREVIRHTLFFQMTHKKYAKKLNKAVLFKKSKIPFKDYEFYRSSYSFYFNKIHNIIGDGEKNAISYYNLTRKNTLKKHSLSIKEKPLEIRQLLNAYNDKRDWSSHFNISDGRAKTENPGVINKNQINITTPKYADISLAIDLFHDHDAIINKIIIIKDYIERDYYSMFNSEIVIKEYTYDTIGLQHLETSETSYEYSKSSKHSKW